MVALDVPCAGLDAVVASLAEVERTFRVRRPSRDARRSEVSRVHAVTAALATVAVFAGCGAPPCENEIARRVPSPDGRLEAVVFRRGCGATTGFSTQVSVVPAGRALPDAPGNAMVAVEETAVEPRWHTATVLELRYPKGAELVQREYEAEGARVEYRPVAETARDSVPASSR